MYPLTQLPPTRSRKRTRVRVASAQGTRGGCHEHGRRGGRAAAKRVTRRVLVLSAFLVMVGCVDEFEARPEPLGPRLIQISPTWCASACDTVSLYREGLGLELQVDRCRFHDRAYGTLVPQAQVQLDELMALLESGEQVIGDVPEGTWTDLPIVEIDLDTLHLRYPLSRPPSGVEALDALLVGIVYDLANCRASTDVTPDYDCEVFLQYPY